MYSFNVIPKVGGLVANDEESYRYLVESIRKFPDQVSGLNHVRLCTCVCMLCHIRRVLNQGVSGALRRMNTTRQTPYRRLWFLTLMQF